MTAPLKPRAGAAFFNADYYDFYYRNTRTRAVAPADTARQAAFVMAYLAYLRVNVRQVLDVGCGLGLWRDPVLTAAPKAKYRGVEYSEYLCQQYGWVQGEAQNYMDGKQYDLIISQSVLQYLDDRQCRKALRNFAAMCRGALYLEVPTQRDWEKNVNQKSTDGNVHLRDVEWYRKALKPHFVDAGGGLFVSKRAPVVFYELEVRR